MRIDTKRLVADAEVSSRGKLGGSHHAIVTYNGTPPDGGTVVDGLWGRDVPFGGKQIVQLGRTIEFTRCIKMKGSRDRYPLCLCRGGLSSIDKFRHRISGLGGLRVPHGFSNAVKRKLPPTLRSPGFQMMTYSSSPGKEMDY